MFLRILYRTVCGTDATLHDTGEAVYEGLSDDEAEGQKARSPKGRSSPRGAAASPMEGRRRGRTVAEHDY